MPDDAPDPFVQALAAEVAALTARQDRTEAEVAALRAALEPPRGDPDADLFEALWAYDEGKGEAFAARDALRLARHDPDLTRSVVAAIGEGGAQTIKLGIWLRRQCGRDFGERRTVVKVFGTDAHAGLWALSRLP
jgi:hypothetical protein